MSYVNPYITTDINELENLNIMFRKYISKESRKKKNISEITFIDNDKYKINNTEFKLLWNSMKVLAYDPTHLFLLEHFEKLRKIIVDSLLFIVIKEMKVCKNNEVRFNRCSSVALGSSAITSDYDINLLSDNPMINAEIIKNFNKLFFKLFNDNSSNIFDTNIYGIGFLNKKKHIIPVEVREQTVIAFVKLVSIEDKYGYNITDEFDIQNKFFKGMHKDAKDFYMSRVKGTVEEDYINNIKLIQDVLGEGNDLSITEELSIKDQEKIQSLISLANMSANETYFTQGAFLHVVSRLQSDESIELSETDYINSMIENFFEIFKEYSIYKYSLDVDLFLRSSYKYLYRFYDAAKEAKLTIDDDMYDIFKDLDRFRKGKQSNINIQKKMSKLLESLDILLEKDISYPVKLTRKSNEISRSLWNLSEDIENDGNMETIDYMAKFIDIFIRLYNESLLILPSRRGSLDPSRPSPRVLERRRTSLQPQPLKETPRITISRSSDNVMSKTKRLSERRKLRSRNELIE